MCGRELGHRDGKILSDILFDLHAILTFMCSQVQTRFDVYHSLSEVLLWLCSAVLLSLFQWYAPTFPSHPPINFKTQKQQRTPHHLSTHSRNNLRSEYENSNFENVDVWMTSRQDSHELAFSQQEWAEMRVSVCVCVCVCVCMTRRFVDKTIFSKVESWNRSSWLPNQVRRDYPAHWVNSELFLMG
jgi:hypothetical protein